MASPARRRQAAPPRHDQAAEGIDFKAITEATLDVILHCRENAIATYVSPAITSLLGIAPEDLIGRRHLEHVFPEDMPALTQALKSHQAGQTDGRATFRMRHNNGSTVWVEGSGRMLKDAATGEMTLVIVLRDISDRKALEAQLALLALTNGTDAAVRAAAAKPGVGPAGEPKDRRRTMRLAN